jgi:hypothetical protein
MFLIAASRAWIFGGVPKIKNICSAVIFAENGFHCDSQRLKQRIVFSRLYLLLLEYCKVQKSFVYQAKSMSLSVVLAFAMFIVLEYAPFGQGGSCGTLANHHITIDESHNFPS